MNWFRQWFCKHEIQSNEYGLDRPIPCGGYIYQVVEMTTILWCKKCGYSKKIVS